MGVAKAKASVKGRNVFHAGFLYCKNSNRTFAKKNPLCYNVGEGGQTICEIQNTMGRNIGAVEEILVKVVNAPIKKIRITEIRIIEKIF